MSLQTNYDLMHLHYVQHVALVRELEAEVDDLQQSLQAANLKAVQADTRVREVTQQTAQTVSLLKMLQSQRVHTADVLKRFSVYIGDCNHARGDYCG